jgi:hypothetical protein
MTLEDKFAGMAMNEPIKVEIEGEELELDVRVEDIVPLMSMGDSQGEIAEEDVETLTETFREILYRSYLPYFDEVRGREPQNLSDARKKENEEVKEFINGLLVRKLPQLINKVVSELGWDDDGVNPAEQDFPTESPGS